MTFECAIIANVMKLLKIFIVALMLLSFLPLDGLCKDHPESDDHHHCVVVCSASCHAAIVPRFHVSAYPTIISSFSSLYTCSYQDPILDTFKRPPETRIS